MLEKISCPFPLSKWYHNLLMKQGTSSRCLQLCLEASVRPDFVWDWVNFHPSRWYSSVGFGFSMGIMLFTYWCFYCSAIVVNVLHFLGCAYSKIQGPFNFLCSASRRDAQETRREHGQDSWPELDKAIFSTREHHTQYINWRELARGDPSRLGDVLGISQRVSNATVHHLFISFLFVTSIFLFIFLSVIIILVDIMNQSSSSLSSSSLLNLLCFNY